MRSQSRETHRSLAMGNGRDRAMENYEPILSFGEEVAERYDDAPRGDEPEGVAFLRQLAADCRRWSSRSVPGGLRCRWRHGGFASTASTCHRPWSPGCAPSRAATGSA